MQRVLRRHLPPSIVGCDKAVVESYLSELYIVAAEWTGYVIKILNDEYVGGRGQAVGPVSGLQLRAARGLLDQILHTLSQEDFKFVEGDWSRRLGNYRVGYSGDLSARSQVLSWDQVAPSLPPAHLCGSVPLIDLVEDHVKELLLCPEASLLPESEVEAGPNTASLQVVVEEEDRITDELIQRGLLIWLREDRVVRHRGEMVTSGLFGVGKNKHLPDGREVLRLIMNLQPNNRLQAHWSGWRH